MKLKYIPIKPKRIPYYLALILLTLGASLILGFLSFGGMYALLPILPLAFAAFGLSVAYEGEIYLQNIKGALNKLFQPDYLKNHLAKEFILTNFPKNTSDNCPEFFKDYEKQLQLLAAFGHKELDKSSRKRKKKVEKTLKDMEKWFALRLFPKANQNAASDYEHELVSWLSSQQQLEWQNRIARRRLTFHLVKGFSLLAAGFMGLGSTYLIVEAFTVIPFFAAIPFAFWPLIIVPMALIAGAAYGMLTYNAVTDMINNNTIIKWYDKLKKDGLTVRNVLLAMIAVALVLLAIALTICTAGTWWTVATHARPLFAWMKHMPSFVMGIINPVITGISAVFFNVENSASSFGMVYTWLSGRGNFFKNSYDAIVDGYQHLRAMENWLQIVNPFRIILKLTVTPLRVILFLGHLASIAVTSDRMPGVPQIFSALIAIISEGFEDAHYFIGHDHDHHAGHDHDHHAGHDHDHHAGHGHDHRHAPTPPKTQDLLQERLGAGGGHNHNADIPTVILKTLASPVYALAALWDSLSSNLNKPQTNVLESGGKPPPQMLSLSEAWKKQRGTAKEETVELPADAKFPSKKWQTEHAVSRIERYKEKHFNVVFFDRPAARDKVTALNELQKKIRQKPEDQLREKLKTEKSNTCYKRHRLFTPGDETSTERFIAKLPARVNAI